VALGLIGNRAWGELFVSPQEPKQWTIRGPGAWPSCWASSSATTSARCVHGSPPRHHRGAGTPAAIRLLAPFHSITSSANDRTLSENLTPSVLAVLRLITNSNLI